MPCYRDGGCGPYESYSCSECPASKPEYLTRRRVATARMTPDVVARRVLTKQSRADESPSSERPARDADDVLRDILRDRRTLKTGTASALISVYLNSADRSSVEAQFLALTGASWTQFLKLSEAVLDENETSSSETVPAAPAAALDVDPDLLAKMPESAKLLLEQIPDWPHWQYKYFEPNDPHPRLGATSAGLAAVPPYAVEVWPAHGRDDENDERGGRES